VEAKTEKSQAKRRWIPVPAKVAIVWIGIYLFLKFFKPPLPSSLIFMYMTTVTVGLALSVSIYENILHAFTDPIVEFLRGDAGRAWPWRVARWAVLIAIPVYVGSGVYQRVVPRFEPPIASRVIHPAPPPEVAAFYNEFRDDEENLKKYIEEGLVVYFQNCFFCHGDALDGEGPFAHGMNPPPADFQDPGTIAQLSESFVFWRISTGGPGLPDESTPWDSFMPRWEDMLSDEQRWKVILYLYDLTGWSPRTWGEEEVGAFEEEEEEHETAEKGPEKTDDLEATRVIYEKRCAPCHGKKGEGNGPAAGFMMPRPRNFTWGIYKFRSTLSGFVPTDEDLFRTIRHGLPGTAMPGWPLFTDDEIKGLIHYIKAFAPDEFEEAAEEKPEIIQVGTPPEASPELIEKGNKIFHGKAKCFECHGNKGRGNEIKLLKDDWGYRVFPRNLTHPWEYRRGTEATLEIIYLAVTTGLYGTPMPSFKEPPFSLSDEDRWALAHYVRSLQTQRKLGFTLVAKLVEKLPSDPEDPLWDSVDYLDIPMVGQVVMKPRMFTPRVNNVRVQAVYNDKDVAFRLVWDDTTETKPDPASEIFKDAIAVQFPVTVPTGSKRPYFLMGDEDNPVHLWRWSSERSDAIELNAKGSKQVQVQSESGQQVTAKLKYDDGQYRLVFKRGLSTPDKDLDIQFAPGQFIPMSFFAWDGANKETGVKSSISSWYFLLLEPTTPATVYLYPFVAILFMGGAEWWVIGRIRKNKGRGA
jgi:DMSO reductase family type II enzyme heme b subunit